MRKGSSTKTVNAVGVSMLFVPLVLVTIAWVLSVGNLGIYFTTSLPPGQLLYVLSKLTGLLALVMLGMQAILALIKGVRWPKRLPDISFRTHIRLGILTFMLCVLHVGFIFAAMWLRQDKPPLALLLPDFSAGYYKVHVSLGVIGFYALCVGVVAGWKSRNRRTGWKKLHMIWPLPIVLAYWHSLGIGSETRTDLVFVVLWVIAALVAVALLIRVASMMRARDVRDVLVKKTPEKFTNASG